MKKKNPMKVLFKEILGIIFFLISLAILNIISYYVANQTFHSIVAFLNINLVFILVLSLIMLLAEVFKNIIFPFDLVYPIFNAVGTIFIIIFIFKIFELLDSLIGINIAAIFSPALYVIIVLVFILVLIISYVNVFIQFSPRKKEKKEKKKKQGLEWEDVGEEFKAALYNLASTIKDNLEPKKKKKRSR